MKESHNGRHPKPQGNEPPVHLKPNRPGVDSVDEARIDAAEESIGMMQAVEHPGEFPPAKPEPKKRPT